MNTRIYFLTILVVSLIACDSQQPDRKYDVSVKEPFFTTVHPSVLFDEAHNNIHTSSGTYSPFVNLIKNDGCLITPNDELFTRNLLRPYDLLVISNAKGDENKNDAAFNDDECLAVEEWVRNGGSLFLIADHYPFGGAAKTLAHKFGVTLLNGEVMDSIHYEGNAKYRDELIFSSANKLLADHPIINGRNEREKVSKVMSFRGQSLVAPANAVKILSLSSSAYEMLPDSTWKEGGKTYTRFAAPVSAQGHCQALALTYGKGKVLILGEAAMITAQVYKDEKFGMNFLGNDNRQFALNCIHWLATRDTH